MADSSFKIITTKSEMRSFSRANRNKSKTLALIPTMGYLHDGHLSLINQSKSLADVIIVSIYVNPGQFSPSEDLSTYPSDFQGDLQKLERIGGVHCVFSPKNLYDYEDVTKDDDSNNINGCCVESGHESWIRVERLEKGLCGKSRPVFFRGVATIVAKLFNIVEPDVALFGKKDYQQWKVICRMVRDLDFAIEIIGGDIVREDDGLAMSSRNVRLSSEERKKALSIYKSLLEAKNSAQNGKIKCQELTGSIVQVVTEAGGRVDYVEPPSHALQNDYRLQNYIFPLHSNPYNPLDHFRKFWSNYIRVVDQESLKPVVEIKSPVVICVAAWFGNVRLIDNMEINL